MIDLTKVESLFFAALEKPSEQERAAFLNDACGDDAELRQHVERMVAAHPKAVHFLEAPESGPVATVDELPVLDRPGTAIGPYKLLQQLGQGGMGVVYLAEQQEPVRRHVALKVVKAGMDSAQVIARFEAERQALALMDHPHIAKVLDAGTTAQGRPYFVMELVKGTPITRYCDEHRLTLRQRLELFVPVCQALQHAHQKGIIHRDIKPSNVLVAPYDGKPVVKVIDFGVAKAAGQRLTERTLFTEIGAVIGTLEYMSPEQAELNNQDIDTRSDIYSLGVLLYQLLTGTTPLTRDRLKQVAFTEMLRIIREEEPPKPSTRLSESKDSLPSVSAQRQMEPVKLTRLVRGEIDWIVMKALEKDRSRRYDAASGLAKDIERYLAEEPVEAGPPSAGYRLRKLARKHRKALATAAAFAVLLVAGALTSTVLAVWATSAEKEATRQQIASETAKQEAVEARGEADRQRDEARVAAYTTGIGQAQHAWDTNNVLRARELLAEVPREAAGRDLRGFEWYYLSRLCNTDVPTFQGHTDSIWSVAFSPDGQRLASASNDRTVRLWDSLTGKELLCLKGHPAWVESVAFSPDGQRLASSSRDGTVKIWDAATGEQRASLTGRYVAFSPDGQRLASSSRGDTVKIWDSTTGRELVSIKDAALGGELAFSPDGRRLASGSWGPVLTIWDSATGEQLLSLKGHTGTVYGVAFSPDGRRVASGSVDGTVKVWDSATGRELLSSKGHTNAVRRVAFSPDGRRVASAGYDGTVRIWDGSTGTELACLKGHAGPVRGVAFSPDGQHLASGSMDKTVRVWDSATTPELLNLKSHVDKVTGVAFSPDGQRLASASRDKSVKVWDGMTGQELLRFKGHTDSVWSVAFSPDGRRLASASRDKTVKVWDGVTGRELVTFTGHDAEVCGVAFSPDGRRLASASMDRTVKVWDSATGKELTTLKGHEGLASWNNGVVFSPDGRRVASGGEENTVKVWDSATGKELVSLPHEKAVAVVAFSPDGRRLASANWDQTTVTLWDSATGQRLASFRGHSHWVTGVAFSQDGRRLASASWDQTVRIWDCATGKELISLGGNAGYVHGVAFSPDGRRLASANGDGSLSLWESSISPEVQERRAAQRMVADLFAQLGLRAAVLERLRTVPGMNPTRRQEALAAAQTYPENPLELNERAWELLTRPGRGLSDYRQALRYSEAACQLEPGKGVYLTTLGAAHYRVGDDDAALAMLVRADQINQKQQQGSVPADLAFLCLAYQRQGHAQEARAMLQRLQDRVKDPRWAQDAQAQALLHEVEAFLANSGAAAK